MCVCMCLPVICISCYLHWGVFQSLTLHNKPPHTEWCKIVAVSFSSQIMWVRNSGRERRGRLVLGRLRWLVGTQTPGSWDHLEVWSGTWAGITHPEHPGVAWPSHSVAPGHKQVRRWAQVSKGGDFPGGTVVQDPPANAGDMGSNPGPGRSHMLPSN